MEIEDVLGDANVSEQGVDVELFCLSLTDEQTELAMEVLDLLGC